MSRSATPVGQLAFWLVTLSVLAAGCQFSDIAAFHNATESAVTLRAEVDGEFAQYDCGGSGSDLIRFEGETEVEIQPGQRICLEGPATEFEDSYDVLEMLFVVEITRAGDLCVELQGEEVFDEFVVDGGYKTLVVDNERCPGDERDANAEPAE